jgi:hypothetical protein
LNNEPVAWTACLDCGKRVTGDSIHTCSPQLKTLTAQEVMEQTHRNISEAHWKAKTLTDEEILIEAKYQPNLGYYLACEYDVLDFARAILRKAQEK